MSARKLSYPLKYEHSLDVPDSVRSRRLEVWAQERTGAREGDTQEETEGGGVPSPLACLPLARPFFLAPTTSKRLLGRLGPWYRDRRWNLISQNI